MASFFASPRRSTFLSNISEAGLEGATNTPSRRDEGHIELRDLSESPKSTTEGLTSSRSRAAGTAGDSVQVGSPQSSTLPRRASSRRGVTGSKPATSSLHASRAEGGGDSYGSSWTPRLDENYGNGDVMSALSRQYRNISQDLQTLLDAQSDGLMKALGGGAGEPPATSASPSPSVDRSAGEMSHRSQVHALETSSFQRRQSDLSAVSAHSRASIYRDDPLDSKAHLAGSSITASTSRQAKSRLFHVDKGTTIPVRQPPKPKPPTLKQARVGILHRLEALQQLKTQELQLHNATRDNAEVALYDLVEMQSKRRALVSSMDKAESEGLKRAHEERQLADEEKQIQEEIAALERRLEGLRAELRFKSQEKQALRSEREAEVSSYRNALAELDGKIKREVLSDDGKYAGGKEGRRRRRKEKMRAEERQRRLQQVGDSTQELAMGDGEVTTTETNVWSLPESRRTIDMVIDSTRSDISQAKAREDAAEVERNACVDGHAVWASAVRTVDKLEKQLGKAIHAFSRSQVQNQSRSKQRSSSRSASRSSHGSQFDTLTEIDMHDDDGFSVASASAPSSANDTQKDPSQIMHAFFRSLDAGTAQLQDSVAEAQRRGWSFLQVALAAELEALHVARELLGDTLSESGGDWSHADKQQEEEAHAELEMRQSTVMSNVAAAARMAASQRTVRPDSPSVVLMQKAKSADQHRRTLSGTLGKTLSGSGRAAGGSGSTTSGEGLADVGADVGGKAAAGHDGGRITEQFGRYRDEADDDDGGDIGNDEHLFSQAAGTQRPMFVAAQLTGSSMAGSSARRHQRNDDVEDVAHDGPDPQLLFGA